MLMANNHACPVQQSVTADRNDLLQGQRSWELLFFWEVTFIECQTKIQEMFLDFFKLTGDCMLYCWVSALFRLRRGCKQLQLVTFR